MTKQQWLTLLLFKLGWATAVLGGESWLVVQLGLLGTNLIAISGINWRLLMGVSLAGMVLDITLSLLGVFQFTNNAIIPAFLIVLWLHFALLIAVNNQLLPSSRSKLMVYSALIGAWGYGMAALLGALKLLPSAPIAAIIVFVTWGLWIGPVIWYLQRSKRTPTQGAT